MAYEPIKIKCKAVEVTRRDYMMTKLVLVLCLIVINFCLFSRGELFTALSDIEPLLRTHERVVNDLHEYITKEEERVHVLKRFLEIYKREHVKAMEDVPNYLGNPINAFTLIKRMTTDLDFVKQNIDLGAELASKMVITQYSGATYPSAEDLRGAARALTRLQDTYLLKVEDLAEGILNGIIHRTDVNDDNAYYDNDTKAVSSKMSASDCYVFGKILFDQNDYRRALDWMMASLSKFYAEDNSDDLNETDILQHISLSHKFLGNIRDALKWAEKMLEIDPNNADVLKIAIELQKVIETEKRKSKSSGETGKFIDHQQENITLDHNVGDDLHKYNALCRGEVEVPPEISKQLKCRYYNENSFLKLAPIKMEYKYHNPDIVFFYEVLSGEEIETIKGLAQPRFKRATVRDKNSGEVTPVDYRISKSAWLTDEESPVVERVTRRVADFTGLNMNTADFLQVVNYGIGGHYLPHYDHATSNDPQFPDKIGNRIATVIFYMSDVAQGGATVFTELGLSLFPVRGAAAVWLNLHASGEGDLATRHAACPVLRGSKWVSNKWIHLVGQEFRRPCGLEYQAEDMIRPIIKPGAKILK